MKVKKFEIKAGTYPYTIRVIICRNIKTVVDYVNRKQYRKGSEKYKPSDFKNSLGRFCRHDKYCPVIWIPKKPKTARQLCTVAHEVLHAVFANMEWFGITYNRNSEEAYTYLHVHLMEQFLNKCGIK